MTTAAVAMMMPSAAIARSRRVGTRASWVRPVHRVSALHFNLKKVHQSNHATGAHGVHINLWFIATPRPVSRGSKRRAGEATAQPAVDLPGMADCTRPTPTGYGAGAVRWR